MSEQHGKGIRSSRKLWRWIKNQMIQDVPEDDAVCEFDCPKGQCTVGEWKTCETRLRKAACGQGSRQAVTRRSLRARILNRVNQ